MSKTISIKDDNGKEYIFEMPEFECGLLKVIENNRETFAIGYIYDYQVLPCVWNLDNGICYYGTMTSTAIDGKYNLTPIKPKWYEDESNFPALMTYNRTSFGLSHSKRTAQEKLLKGWRLATKEEVMSLYYEGKE